VREKVLRYIRERSLLRAGDRLAVAVSGGADSVALLRLLLEMRADLGVVLVVAHFNHGMRGEASQADEAFVGELAREHGLEFFVGRADVRDHAFTAGLSIEAAGRFLRYRWLTTLAAEQRLDAIATAHTRDDQAETVLLKFLRGASTRGLAGIYPAVMVKPRSQSPGAEALSDRTDLNVAAEAAPLQAPLTDYRDREETVRIVRPLLSVSRQEVENYLSPLKQSWREDESNLDRSFTRNRVRHELLPLLEREFNPNIRQVLNDLAEVARGEEEFWQQKVLEQLATGLGDRSPGLTPSYVSEARVSMKSGSSVDPGHDPERLDLDGFAALPFALQRRLLKHFVERAGIALDFEHVENLRRGALDESKTVELPGGRTVRNVGSGYLELSVSTVSQESPVYEYRLLIPGELQIEALRLTLRALTVAEQFACELENGNLLDAELVGAALLVRNWRPGDRFWPAHSRSEEKLKRLFAEKKIPAEQRASWPVGMSGGEIVWVRGFPVAREFQWRGNGEAVKIEERESEKSAAG
jgi:tRNA(Ile)-lysidine synthase